MEGGRSTRRALFLARHGETAWNSAGRWQGHSDIALSEVGRAQAASLGERLRGLDVGHIYSSDLLRAAETAQIAAQTLGIAQIKFDERLRERGFGVFEGLTREECAVRHPDAWALYTGEGRIVPPGAEPYEAVVDRMQAAVKAALAEQTTEQAVLVVGHGASLRAFLGGVFARTFPPIGNTGLLRVDIEVGRYVAVNDLGSATS